MRVAATTFLSGAVRSGVDIHEGGRHCILELLGLVRGPEERERERERATERAREEE
jgi:hypothetical protein